MLSLINIKKQYDAGGTKVDALKGININFRQNEFVSILGPSGCGKTTTLNIIGGLDHYTSGDLIIDGKSTKNFNDKDWDAYRSHKIGFVFQNYNLIQHLSVLKNVEIALSMNDTKAKEREERAKEMLTLVGLKDQMSKKPNQLSGGQMQRVAIARALANNPDIILADEPTGALDSKTSVQIMKLLKKISKTKLVIMVTHNQDLAKKYSTRIIKLFDGEMTNDSNSYSNESLALDNQKIENAKKMKSSMSFLTALNLSFKNLLIKKGRTFLTSFAGSIGIIGIALVLAISNGLTSYINNMQTETLSSYPISVSTATIDYSSFSSFEREEGTSSESQDYVTVYDSNLQKYIKYGHFNYISEDFVSEVKSFENEQTSKGENSGISLVQYNYYTPIKILVKQADNTISLTQNQNSLSILSGTGKGTFYEALSDEDYMFSQYDTVYTSSSFVEGDNYGLTLVLNEGNKLNSSILSSIGIKLNYDAEKNTYENVSFESICSKQFKLIYNNDYYTYDSENNHFTKLSSIKKTNETLYQSTLSDLYDSASSISLKITKIIRPKADSKSSILPSGVMYSSALASRYRANCAQSEIAIKQAQRKAQEDLLQESSETKNYTFYAPLEITISEFPSMISSGFVNTNAINNFLNSYFTTTISAQNAYKLALQQIGTSAIPQSIVFYPNNFTGKSATTDMINSYNKTVGSAYQIIFSDASDMLTSTLGTLINIVSYVLIAFAAVSLVVSSIMIGIITYVSVIERTKEIGILRAIGARKKDVSRVFNAETLLIGFMAGIIGIGLSYLICILINLIVNSLQNQVSNVAMLNPIHALILICVSMILTFISGLIPSTIASKKDPVECLRTE